MAYIGAGITRFNTADDLTVTDDAEIKGDLVVEGTADINGGTIDGVTIGGTTPAAGTFTTFTSTGIDDNASATAVTIDSSGNVGIGTTSPETQLHVATGHIRVNGTLAGGATLQTSSSGGLSTLTSNDPSNNNFNLLQGTNNSGVITFSTRTSSSNYERVRIDNRGRVTMPYQPAFLAFPSSNQTDLPITTTAINFGSEVFDQGNDFTSSTFTAPVTGKYQLNATLRLENVDSAHNYTQMRINTSNRFYRSTVSQDLFLSDADYFALHVNALCDMDAGDTAYVQLTISGGAVQTDVHIESMFSGYLVA